MDNVIIGAIILADIYLIIDNWLQIEKRKKDRERIEDLENCLERQSAILSKTVQEKEQIIKTLQNCHNCESGNSNGICKLSVGECINKSLWSMKTSKKKC